MSQRNKAIQAMRKIVNRQRGVGLEDALKPAEKELLVAYKLAEWEMGTGIDGQPVPYLLLTEAGMITCEFARSEKKWKRKWEIIKERADRYWTWGQQAYDQLNTIQNQWQTHSGDTSKFKLTIDKVTSEIEHTD